MKTTHLEIHAQNTCFHLKTNPREKLKWSVQMTGVTETRAYVVPTRDLMH